MPRKSVFPRCFSYLRTHWTPYFPGPSELSGPETRVADSVPHWRSETRGFARLGTYYIHEQPTTGQSLRRILLLLFYVIFTPVSEGGYYFPRFAEEEASSEQFNHGADVTKPQTRFRPEPLLKSEHVLLRDSPSTSGTLTSPACKADLSVVSSQRGQNPKRKSLCKSVVGRETWARIGTRMINTKKHLQEPARDTNAWGDLDPASRPDPVGGRSIEWQGHRPIGCGKRRGGAVPRPRSALWEGKRAGGSSLCLSPRSARWCPISGVLSNIQAFAAGAESPGLGVRRRAKSR